MNEINCRIEAFIDYDEFLTFVKSVENDFVPPLLNRIDPVDYYIKISSHGIVVKCFKGQEVAGILIMYANNLITKKAFITFIATKKTYRGLHIATSLLEESFKKAKEEGMETIDIETNNPIAKACYLKAGFKVISNIPINDSGLYRTCLTKTL